MSGLQGTCIVTGCLLISAYGLVRGYSVAYSTAAMLQFEDASKTARSEAANSREDGASSDVDFSLWSDSRIRSFQQSLGIEVEQPIALLEIENLGVRVPVFAGTDRRSLNRGAGWIAGTALPEEQGNVGIAGHRDGFFRPLKDIGIGDEIRLTTGDREELFQVVSTEIVEPADTYVLRPSDEKTLTLVTCFPFYFVGSAPQRFIVRAGLRAGGGPASSTEVSPQSQ